MDGCGGANAVEFVRVWMNLMKKSRRRRRLGSKREDLDGFADQIHYIYIVDSAV